MKQFFRNNGLSFVSFGLFAFSLAGQYLAGFANFNESRREHGQMPVTYFGYSGEGHFIEAVFENWESEFLSTGAMVVFTIFPRQKGSPESKPAASPHSETGSE